MPTISIANDADLFAVLEQVAERTLGPDTEIEFRGWPNYEVIIRGEDFEGGIPTRIMPAIMDLQRQVYAAVALMKYGAPQRLTREERKLAELVVHFEAGHSTKFFSELWKILNPLVKEAAGKMNGTQLVVTILGIAALASSSYVWKEHLIARLDEKGMEHSLQLSQEETRRQELMARIATDSPAVHELIRQNRSFQDHLLKRLDESDQLVVDGTPLIDGKTAQQAIRAPRMEAVESRFDGQFMIISVESGLVRGGFRLKVREVSSGEELTVKVPEGTLTEDQISTLQKGEWGKHPLAMQMNVKKLRDRITDATLIEAGLR
jgi:hypothetical protein